MTFDPKSYEPGDVVEIRQTFEIKSRAFRSLIGADVKSGEEFVFGPSDDTMKVRMVKRAARPKPKAGDVLRGGDIQRRMWKRGTSIRFTRTPDGRDVEGMPALVLFADGMWHDVEGFSAYEFDDLNPEGGFELLLVA